MGLPSSNYMDNTYTMHAIPVQFSVQRFLDILNMSQKMHLCLLRTFLGKNALYERREREKQVHSKAF